MAETQLNTQTITFKVGTEDLRLDLARDLFLNALAGARSPKTVKWYGGQCNPDGRWQGGQLQLLLDHFGEHTAVNAITLDHLRRWRAIILNKKNKRTGKRLSVWSADSAIRAAKSFFNWLENENHLTHNPASRLERPQLPKRAQRGVTDNDAATMWEAARDAIPRDRAILAVFDATGCRLGGLADLRMEDIDLEHRRLLIREKGDKERTVFLTQTAAENLKTWLDERQAKPGVNHAFTSLQTGQRHGDPLTASGIAQIIKRLKNKAGITGRVSPHQWRHRRLRKLTANGAPLGIVADIAGHADSRTTHQYYGAFAVDELQSIYDRFVENGEQSN